jgi:diguanylate cyclase (GGDEF)-like protein
VLGRLGGDEFTVLAAIDPESGVTELISRLQQRFRDYNIVKTTPYQLSISIGVAELGDELPLSIEQLLAAADAAMYENKRAKKAQAGSGTSEPDLNAAVA